ncbi:glutathione S-transferase N-terminal domain-containing protein [Halostella litorea]|uniref:glutathione S-transferase N-terminal domain-containing protein n=1 Tax=Halostella litorea TaxID=2528831 RepID=UPI00109318F5|nr:glutathione S-transferase N-terminal domain-containing protein [Halostella litorea]
MLELYQAEGCPHSETVREKLTDLGLSYVAHNPRRPGENPAVLNEQVHAELRAVAGEDTIPVLVDHDRGEVVTESDRIESYLGEHYGDLR